MKLLRVCVMTLIAIILFTVQPTFGGYEKTVDILCLSDEDFELDAWMVWIDSAFEALQEKLGIVFKIRGWLWGWDSDDSEHRIDELLEDAIDDTNYESHVTEWNGYVIDLLLVFTGQDTSPHVGWSPPEWKALIISDNAATLPRTIILMHELSHQFYAQHCDNHCVCVMSTCTNPLYMQRNWCESCKTTILSHKDRFWRENGYNPDPVRRRSYKGGSKEICIAKTI